MVDRRSDLDTLISLDGVSFFIDAEGVYRVQFVVKRIEATPDRPHGLRYSLTLHGARGERLVGFDNAHPVPKQKGPAARRSKVFDHHHRFRSIRPYEYQDAATLLSDFWQQVDEVLQELGVSR